MVLGLAACASTGDQPGPRTSPGVVTITPEPAKTSTYAEREQSRFQAEGADGMVAAAGALWAKTDTGHVLRIDPRTNKVTADLVVDKHTGQSFYCQGIGADGQSVWACSTRSEGTGVVRIDPDTARIEQQVRVGKVFDQLALPSTARGIWVLTHGGTEISVVDPGSGHVTTYPLGVRCQQVGAGGSRVVATDVVGGNVVVVDAGTGTVVDRLTVDTPRMAVVVGGDIWVDSAAGLVRFSDGLKTRTVYAGITAGQGGDLFSEGGSVWLRASDGTIFRIEATSGKLLERIDPSPKVSAGSLVVAFGSIWTTGSEEGVIIRLRE
ncbi:MAG: hypothetical protein ACJ72O_06370 [Marmoricola sp.]